MTIKERGLQLEQGMEAVLVSLQIMSYPLQYRQSEKPFYRPSIKYSSRFPYTSEHYGLWEATK